jgi:hypothetical protein
VHFKPRPITFDVLDSNELPQTFIKLTNKPYSESIVGSYNN